MSAHAPNRGDGVGIEIAGQLVRGVRLAASEPDRLAAAAEVAIESVDDDRSTVDALVRLRAELGDPVLPTRIAIFPPGSTLTRADATGLGATELNRMRSDLTTSRGISSTVLVDDGPRRWLFAVRWDDARVRRVEELAERAGFVDVAVDPSPLALARVVDPEIHRLRRDAAPGVAVTVVTSAGLPIAAATTDVVGRTPPALVGGTEVVSEGWFDDLTEAADVVAEVHRLIADGRPVETTLRIDDSAYPSYPPHDLRSPQRQCVALGAAAGAAGLAGRLRPVDLVRPAARATESLERPWAVERVSSLPPPVDPPTIGPVKKMLSRMMPRRRPRPQRP